MIHHSKLPVFGSVDFTSSINCLFSSFGVSDGPEIEGALYIFSSGG